MPKGSDSAEFPPPPSLRGVPPELSRIQILELAAGVLDESPDDPIVLRAIADLNDPATYDAALADIIRRATEVWQVKFGAIAAAWNAYLATSDVYVRMHNVRSVKAKRHSPAEQVYSAIILEELEALKRRGEYSGVPGKDVTGIDAAVNKKARQRKLNRLSLAQITYRIVALTISDR
jgi:hypothetical protein